MFPVIHCPKKIRDYADGFSDLFTPNQYCVFTSVLCATIFGVSKYSDVVRYMHFSPSVSSISDFYNFMGMVNKMNRRHRRRLLSILKSIHTDPNRYQWVIDDTLIERTGKKIWGTYQWKDHNTGGYIWGHKLLVLGIHDRKRNLLIPVFWEILHRDLRDLVEDGALDDYTHKKGWEVALELLKASEVMGFPKLVVSADSWFACDELFQALDKEGYNFEIEIKSNRIVASHGRLPVNVGVDEFFSDRLRSLIFRNGNSKFSSEAVLKFKDSDIKLKVVAIANIRNLKETPFAYYVSNKTTWNAHRIWGYSRHRWGIEVQFRDLKQYFTLGEAAGRSKEAVETTISVAAIALTVIRLEQLSQADGNLNQHARPLPAGVIVRDFKIESMILSISKLASEVTDKHRKKFHCRINRENLKKKPVEFHRSPKAYPYQGKERIPA